MGLPDLASLVVSEDELKVDDDDDEVTEPTKRPKKKEKPPKDDDDDLSNIIDEWGSDDS